MIEVATWGFGGTGPGIAVWGWLDEVTTAGPIAYAYEAPYYTLHGYNRRRLFQG